MAIIDQVIQDRYAAYNADTMEVLPTLADDSIDFTVFSPPFPETFAYSNDPRDLANCATYEEGLRHYGFIVDELHRLTKPGRLVAVHCMDLKKGTWFQRDFPGDIVRTHVAAGFNFFCRVTIWKDPWVIARRTRMRSLMHKTIVSDSSLSRVAGPDYVLVFRKSGENAVKIQHPHGLKTYAGSTPVPGELLEKYLRFKGDQRKNLLSHWIWRQYASPVWMDIRGGKIMPFIEAKGSDEESHICPLQQDIIERCLTLWSNPDDVVLTPFMGVGSEVAGAVLLGRKGVGTELKPTYFRQAVKNIEAAMKSHADKNKTLFDDVPSSEEELGTEDYSDSMDFIDLQESDV